MSDNTPHYIIHAPQLAYGSQTPITSNDMEVLMGAIPDDDPSFDVVKLVSQTAIRTKELCTLRWKDVDFLRRWLYIGGTRRVWLTPLAEETLLVRRILARSLDEGGEFVFGPNPQATVMAASRKLATLSRSVLGRTIGLHVVRSAFITTLVRSGVSAADLMSIVGWHSRQFLRMYMTPANVRAGKRARRKRSH